MAELAIDDEGGGQVDEAEVGGGSFLPAGQPAAEAVEPTVGDLHDPAPRRVAVRMPGWGQRRRRARLGRDVGGIASGGSLGAARLVVVAPIQDQVRRSGRGRLDDRRVEQRR